MQRAAYHHQMASNAPPTGATCYSQGYSPASAYHAFHGNMDYHHAMSMPSMSHHNQLGASMSSAALNQMANSHSMTAAAAAGHMTSHAMTSHGLHSAAMHQRNYVKDECLDYPLDKSTPISASAAAATTAPGDWKFQML